jgi:hypothetical protein
VASLPASITLRNARPTSSSASTPPSARFAVSDACSPIAPDDDDDDDDDDDATASSDVASATADHPASVVAVVLLMGATR